MNDEQLEALKESLDDIRTRLRLLESRGVVTLVYDPETDTMQKVQVTGLASESLDDVEHAQPYGLSVHPVTGAEAFLSQILGQRNHAVAHVISDPRKEPQGKQDGEVVVWSAHGQTIWLRIDKGLTIDVPGGDLKINAPEGNVTITGNCNVTVGGDATVSVGGDASVSAGGDMALDAAGAITLGNGNVQPVARIGDLVNVGSGSSAGQWPIVSGSSQVKAGG